MPTLETLLINLIHDLRQPLGNIEGTTYCLSSLVGSADARIRDQVRLIERQVERAEQLLAAASAELARVRVQRCEVDVTNSAIRGVT
jgi:signal transduction histidine kinase